MATDFKALTKDVQQHRDEIIERMVNFSLTDALLFRDGSAELLEREKQIWDPILDWAKDEIQDEFKCTDSLEVPEENNASLPMLQVFLESLSDKELAAFYVAARNTKSALLAAALIKGRIDGEEAFQAAYLPELWQAEKWGADEEADRRRAELKAELLEVENFIKAA